MLFHLSQDSCAQENKQHLCKIVQWMDKGACLCKPPDMSSIPGTYIKVDRGRTNYTS